MAANRDYYDVLGVTRTATAEEIRSAWRGLVRQFHPDVSDEPDAEARFNEVQEAYDVLSDEKKRAEYDQYGHAGAAHGGWGGGPSVDSGQFQDIFDGIFSGGGGGGFRPGGSTSRGPRRGTDLRMELSITFRTAALGGGEQVKLKDGTSIEVKVPRGIEDEDTLRLKGRGGPGAPGADAGDLLLTIRVGRHPALRRVGRDLFMDVPISIAEAALGTTVHIALLEGSIDLKIPAGTSSGQKLRVTGRGIEDASGKQGDFYSVVQIMAPSELSDRMQSLLNDLADELPDPRDDAPGVGSVPRP
ncbi:MAG: DnaJ C-terminal domain-containing protein [Phycisphaerales bacterium]|nr:DnaJ C-terminal domain-containing protein [Phycisphaerales bacterium]